MKWHTAGIEVAVDRRCTWVAFCGVSKVTRRVNIELQEPLEGTAVTAAVVAMWEREGLDWLAHD